MTYRSQGIKNLSRVSTESGYTICSVGALNCGDVSDTLISGFSDPLSANCGRKVWLVSKGDTRDWTCPEVTWNLVKSLHRLISFLTRKIAKVV